jgi:hypothetical protein
VVDRTERLAELPANLVDFLRSRGLALAAERRDGGPQAAPVRGIVYAADQFVGLEAIHELGDVGSHARASRGQLAKRHRRVGLHQMGQGGRAASLAPDSSTCAKASSSWLSTACAACISDHMMSSEAGAGLSRRGARRLFISEQYSPMHDAASARAMPDK